MTDKHIRIIVNSDTAEKKVKHFDGAMRGAGKSGDKLTSEMKKVDKEGKSLASTMKPLAAAIAGVLSIQKIVAWSDAWKGAQNQLRQVVDSETELTSVSRQLLQVSNETRSSFEASSELYAGLVRSTQELNVSSGELVDITTTINQLFASGGGDAQSAANAIRQLNQGLAAGALRGDEFNSVAEQAPGIMRALAAETGLNVGQLREFAAQGKITSELVVSALSNYQDEAQAAFDKTEQTWSQSKTIIYNNTIAAIGSIDSLGGSINSVGETFANFSSELAAIAQSGQVDAAISFIADQFEATANDVTNLINAMYGVYQEFVGEIGVGSINIGSAFTNIVPNIRSFVEILTVEIAHAIEIVSDFHTLAVDALNPFDDVDIKQAADNFAKKLQSANQTRADSIDYILSKNKEEITSNDEIIASIKQLRIEYERTNVAALGRGADKSGVTPVAQAPAKDGESQKIQKMQAETEQIHSELQLRQKLHADFSEQIYNQNLADVDRELALLAYKTEEKKNRETLAFEDEIARLEEKRLTISDNAKLADEEKAAYLAEIDAQELLRRQEKEQAFTEIEAEGAAAREQIAIKEAQNKKSLLSNFGNSALQLIASFGDKSGKLQKRVAIFETGVAIIGGVAKALNNPYPLNLGFAATVAAQGATLKSQLDGLKPGGGISSLGSIGGSGATSVSTPSISAASQAAATPTTNQSKTVINFVSQSADDLVRVGDIADVINGVDGVDIAVAIAGQTEKAKQVGALEYE